MTAFIWIEGFGIERSDCSPRPPCERAHHSNSIINVHFTFMPYTPFWYPSEDKHNAMDFLFSIWLFYNPKHSSLSKGPHKAQGLPSHRTICHKYLNMNFIPPILLEPQRTNARRTTLSFSHAYTRPIHRPSIESADVRALRGFYHSPQSHAKHTKRRIALSTTAR
jgi:hypothetical protein